MGIVVLLCVWGNEWLKNIDGLVCGCCGKGPHSRYLRILIMYCLFVFLYRNIIFLLISCTSYYFQLFLFYFNSIMKILYFYSSSAVGREDNNNE